MTVTVEYRDARWCVVIDGHVHDRWLNQESAELHAAYLRRKWRDQQETKR